MKHSPESLPLKAVRLASSFLSYGRDRGHLTEFAIWSVTSLGLGLAIGTVQLIFFP